jgi:hypothetical protein
MKYIKLFEFFKSGIEKYNSIIKSGEFLNWFGDWINDKSKFKFKYNVDEQGTPKIFYHGTNRVFNDFLMEKNRDVRNKTIGNGFFFVDNIETAWKYAYARVNVCLLKDEFFDSLEKYYPQIIKELVVGVYTNGYKAEVWESLRIKYGEKEFINLLNKWEKENNMDINELIDFLEFVEGAAVPDDDPRDQIFRMFNGYSNSLPEWVEEESYKYHFNNALPKFNVVKAFLKMNNTLKTNDRTEVKNATKNGYDSVVFDGSGLVDDIPEYIVYDTNQIKIIN